MSLQPILLVEDSAIDVELALTAIAAAGIRNPVSVARDGAEALEHLLGRGACASRVSGHPCLVLLDLKLPKRDGLEVLAIMKGHDALRVVPVVVLTASLLSSDNRSAHALGAAAYIVKPAGLSALVAAMRQISTFPGIAVGPST